MYSRSRLDAVLAHRKFTEDMLKKDLAGLKKILEGKKFNYFKQEKHHMKLVRLLEEKKSSNMSISELSVYQNYIKKTSMGMRDQKETIRQSEKDVEEKREELITAMKNRKVIEKLRERTLKTITLKENKKEQDFLNDISINQFHRKMHPIKRGI